jgi:hypothetical protein
MTWRLEGTYFENCNCDMICPCTTSGLSAPSDNERCNVAFVFHVDTGEVGGLDVGGLTVCLVADTPALMGDGGWKLGLLMDSAASTEQAEALGAVFGGQLGGPMASLAPLIGEMAGMQVSEMTYSNDGKRHQVTVGNAVEMAVEDFVSPLDPTGLGVRVSGVGFPADTLAAGRSSTARVDVFGMAWDNEGKNSFSAPFAWSA